MKETGKFKISKERFDLQENVIGIYVCRGRIEGISHPVFIPRDSLLAEKLIFQAHKNTLHGGVVLTMTKVRSMPFQVIRTDFAGPIYYCTKKKKKKSADKDNAKFFKAGTMRLKEIIKSEQLYQHLTKENIN